MSSGDPIFQTTLQDLVKGVRSHKKDISIFISKKISEIKNELRSTDAYIKAEAVRKITYLQMIGYDVSWASFAIVEVMSQPKFAHKRIGYLAANQSFTEHTDVILLTTNLFKKEFTNNSLNQYEIGLAINCLANIATPDLARDCISDLVVLMNHSRPYIRKKAVLAMFKLYVRYPQGLRLSFDKLKDRLEDSESAVVSTAVNVICELANKNPKNYLVMAPKFFKLLTTSSNNWMLIKVVKLLGSLVSEEPRLARKLLDPLATIIQNTGAKSLQYECIHTITEALPYTKKDDGSEAKNVPVIVKLCSDYLKAFIEDSDQNLKYLGLVGLVNLMKSHPRYVIDHRNIIIKCLDDDDITIRTRALELLSGIVSKKSLQDLVTHLLSYLKLSEGTYRDELIQKILYMGSKDKFSLVEDFAWYTSILIELSVIGSSTGSSKHGSQVADQLIELSIRVDSVRPYTVESMLSLLLNDKLILSQARQTVCEVLKAAAWIIGEYSEILTRIAKDVYEDEDEERGYWIIGPGGDEIRSDWRGKTDLHCSVLSSLLHTRVTHLPYAVQSVYLQSALKIFLRACRDCTQADMVLIVSCIRQKLGAFSQSVDLEVQERASFFRHLLSELGILSADWRVLLEEARQRKADKEEETAAAQQQKEKERLAAAAAALISTKNNKKSQGKNNNATTANLLDMSNGSASPLVNGSASVTSDTAAALNNSLLLTLDDYSNDSSNSHDFLTTDQIDMYGATIAKKEIIIKILQSLFNEAFYAVHSKAQRRVPLPEDIDLDAVINSKAVQKILDIELPSKISSTDISFIASNNTNIMLNNIQQGMYTNTNMTASSHISSNANTGAYTDAEDIHLSQLAQNTWADSSGSAGVMNSSGGASQNRNMGGDSMYYLQSTTTAGNGNENLNNPLAQTLADTLNDESNYNNNDDGGKKVKKMKKSKDDKKKTAASSSSVIPHFEVDMREILPAGMTASDNEEDDNNGGNKNRKGRGGKKNKNKGGDQHDDDETDLGAIDLTTPLRDDEVYKVLQHRQVASSSAGGMPSFSGRSSDGGNRDMMMMMTGDGKGGEEHKKKSKTKKSSSHKHKHHHQDDHDITNLQEPQQHDMLSLSPVPATISQEHGDRKKDKKSSKTKKSSSESGPKSPKKTHAPSSSASEDLLGLDWNHPSPIKMTTNNSSSGSGSSMKISNSFANIQLQQSPPVSPIVQLQQQQQSSSSPLALTYDILRLHLEPYAVDESVFMNLISQYSSTFINSSMKIHNIQNKPKAVFKTIAKSLNAAIIENNDSSSSSSSSKAISLCIRTKQQLQSPPAANNSNISAALNNILLCVLIKFKKDKQSENSDSITVDMKCAYMTTGGNGVNNNNAATIPSQIINVLTESIQQLSL